MKLLDIITSTLLAFLSDISTFFYTCFKTVNTDYIPRWLESANFKPNTSNNTIFNGFVLPSSCF